MNIAEKILKTDCLLADANKTLYDAKFRASAKSVFTNFITSLTRDRGESIAYLAEFVKGLLSDLDIDPIKQLTHYMLVRNIGEDDFKKATETYIRNHEFPGVRDFINSYKNSSDDKKFIITSRHTFAELAVNYFGADDSVTNKTIFENGVFQRSWVPIKTAADKLRGTRKKLSEYGLDFSDCCFIGDGERDVPIGERCEIFLASPHAKPEVIQKADFFIRDYGYLARKLQQEMQQGL